jgi:glycosyltransferase involved in cell wall biosynthesis
MKLYLTPTEYDVTNGVGQVIHAQRLLLPDFGIELVGSEAEADLTAAHVTADNIKDLDVLHTHGVYYTLDPLGEKADWMNQTNRQIANAAIRARAITTPSYWAGEVFRRDMRINPHVIPNGVWLNQWQPKPTRGYALWAKNRASDVCNPLYPYQLAKLDPEIPVISTFAPKQAEAIPNFKVIGKQSYSTMQEILGYAGVLLSTTKEVDSLQVKEALACGVPVITFNYGGTLDVIEHQKTGWIAPVGNIESVAEGYKWLMSHYDEVRVSCLEAAGQYDWRNIISRYADLYHAVYDQKQSEKHRVSVVITSYNYGKYLSNALDSLQVQTYPADEIIVVDDGSTDNTGVIAKQYEGVKLITQANQGVGNARNNGIATATGDYVVCLDADDLLEPDYLLTCRETLKGDRSIGIAYTGMQSFDERGNVEVWASADTYRIEKQAEVATPPKNQIPCAAMFRRSMWERVNGYKQAYHPAEDAHFWLMGTSIGFKAKRATVQPLFDYRIHKNSATKTKQYVPIHGYVPFAHDKQYPFAAPTLTQALVKSYSQPIVSVVIPVGAGHEKAVETAIESVLGQSFRDWEIVLANDTGQPLCFKAYPFVRIIDTPGKKGAGYARNRAIEAAKAPLLLFLDADDYLAPSALIEYLKAFAGSDGKYIYANNLVRNASNTELTEQNLNPYNQEIWLTKAVHGVTALVPKSYVTDVGMFDEAMEGYEDWDLYTSLAMRGYCGQWLQKPLFVYQTDLGNRRNKAYANHDKLLAYINKKWKGKTIMACCGQGSMSASTQKILNLSDLMKEQSSQSQTNGLVRMVYTGAQKGPITKYVNGRGYSNVNDNGEYETMALPEDVNALLMLGDWRQA